MICCQYSCFTVGQKRIAKEHLSHNLDEHYLEDTRLTWCLSYLSQVRPKSQICRLAAAASRKNSKIEPYPKFDRDLVVRGSSGLKRRLRAPVGNWGRHHSLGASFSVVKGIDVILI